MSDKIELILPEATTNLITNPSFENPVGITGWTSPSGSMAQDSTFQFSGAYSAKTIRNTGGTVAASYAITLTASTTYYLTAWVYIFSFTGDNVSITASSFTGATLTEIVTASETGKWIRVKTKLEVASTVSGTITLLP